MTQSAPESSPSASEPAATGSYGDGMYEVGKEIEPGTYKTDGPGDDSLMKLCTWTKYRDATGSADAISSFNSVTGRSTVAIKPGGYMQFSGGCTWQEQ